MRDEELLREFASRLRAARLAAGMTQAELARRAGLTASAVCSYERARRMPTAASVVKLARALAMSADALLGTSGQVDLWWQQPLVVSIRVTPDGAVVQEVRREGFDPTQGYTGAAFAGSGAVPVEIPPVEEEGER